LISVEKKNLTLGVDVEYKQLYQSLPEQYIEKQIDPIIDIWRKHDSLQFYTPFMHNALYFGIGLNVSYKDRYRLLFKSYFEQRSWSFGTYRHSGNSFYPRFELVVNDTIFFNKKALPIFFNVGDLYSESEYDFGIRAYNIDAQGIVSSVSYKKVEFKMLYIADMAASVGLNIDEYFRLKLLYKLRDNHGVSSEVGVSSDFIQIANLPENEKFSYGVFYRTGVFRNLYFSFISDIVSTNDISSSDIALSAYLHYNASLGKSIIILQPKFKYYGSSILESHYSKYLDYPYRYRSSLSSSNQGVFLYPLKNYFRPVSQWALYTEYRGLGDIYSFELLASWEWDIYKSLSHKLDVELINIHRETAVHGNSYTYLFYTSFLYIELFKDFDVGIYISNKQMNLDVQYQTFYQMKYPFFGFHFTYDGAFDIKTAKKH
jgi:hypothetical protein